MNLYQPVFHRRTPPFSARSLLQTLVLLVVAAGALHGWASRELAGLERHVEGMEAQRRAAEQRLLALQSDLPSREPSALLAAEVRRVTAEVEHGEALVTLLAGPDAGGAGFSAHLEGLARQRVEGLWLTGLRLGAGGREVVIRGSALDAALVPLLVQRLGAEPAFAGMRFAALTIDRADGAAGQVDFVLRTRIAGDEETDTHGG